MKIFLLFILMHLRPFHPGAEIDYKKVFGKDYAWAVDWLKTHDSQMKKYAQQFNLPEKELRAIVFPELIRYNIVFDAIEIESLKYLYVTEGKHYADFSVGYFQMKPSFAEMVEKDAVKMLDSNFIKVTGIGGWQRSADNEDGRRARVKRITNIDQQIIYLAAFYKICLVKFSSHAFNTAIDRIRFLATCYNAGYTRTQESIMRYQSKNQYYKYNYSAVSAYYYEKE